MTEKTGYGNPPKETQFKKGQSGNPKGRPKRKSFEEEILNELNALITINENGHSFRVSKQSALVKRLIAGALSGDIQAVKVLLGRLPQEKNSKQEEYSRFVLNLGDPKVSKKARLHKIEQERTMIIQELEAAKQETDDK